jgi:hypothetical protein
MTALSAMSFYTHNPLLMQGNPMAQPADRLISILDGAIERLLEHADPSIRNSDENRVPGPEGLEAAQVGFSDRLKAVELGIKWVATKHKLDAGDPDDEFSRLRRGTVGRARIRGRSTAPPANGHA